MPIPAAASVAAAIAAEMGNPAIAAQMTIIVGKILDAVKLADVIPGTGPLAMLVPISGPAGVTPVSGKGTLT